MLINNKLSAGEIMLKIDPILDLRNMEFLNND